MHNLYVNNVRAASHTRTTSLIDHSLHPDPAVTDNTAMLLDLSSALDRLEPTHREVILLVGLEQLSYEEKAIRTGPPRTEPIIL